MERDYPAGGFDDWISNLTQEGRQYLICHECGTYIANAYFWKIDGEVLCDDCARARYQFGTNELDYDEL